MSKKLTIKIITLFPRFIDDFLENFGILKKAALNKLLDMRAVDLRQFGLGPRKVVDDRPYGGGVGMVLRPDVLLKAVRRACSVQRTAYRKKQRVILLTPQGKTFTQKDAQRLGKYDELIFVCGRYEGFDERARKFADEELSIGDYILMGGELPALVISEAVMRLRPGILGKIESTEHESFSERYLEYPQYTKPYELKVQSAKLKMKTLKVPEVLTTGNHQKINEWRKAEAEKRTRRRRPDLLE